MAPESMASNAPCRSMDTCRHIAAASSKAIGAGEMKLPGRVAQRIGERRPCKRISAPGYARAQHHRSGAQRRCGDAWQQQVNQPTHREQHPAADQPVDALSAAQPNGNHDDLHGAQRSKRRCPW